MIDRLISALRATGVDPDWREVADVVWLAVHDRTIDSLAGEPTAENHEGSRSQEPGDDGWEKAATATRDPTKGESEKSEPAAHQAVSTRPTSLREREQSSGRLGLALSRAAEQAADIEASVGESRRMALPGQRDLARALRPLKQTRTSRVLSALDVDRTVEEFCRSGVLMPQLQPARVRWFEEVALVVDEHPTMAVWRDTVDELEALLNRFGSSDRVSRWTLGLDDSGAYLRPRTRQRASRHEDNEDASAVRHDVRHLVDYDGRRLVLMVTDCVGPLWRGEHGWQAIDAWGRRGPAAIVQVLPERLWPATAMGPANVALTSDQRGEPNLWLEAATPWWWDSDDREHAVPVVTLDADRLQVWARMVMGGGARAAGVLLHPDARPPRLDVDARPEASPDEMVKAFRSTVSAEAADLATMLSAVDVSLSVARVLLRALIPGPRLSHLSELLSSGLLKQVAGEAYDFKPGVRKSLQDHLTVSMTLDVWRAITPYLERNTDGATPFSILFDTSGSPVEGDEDPLAAVVDTLAERFGIGRFEPADELPLEQLETAAVAESFTEAPDAASSADGQGEAFDWDLPIRMAISSAPTDEGDALEWEIGAEVEQRGAPGDIGHLLGRIVEARGAERTRAVQLAAEMLYQVTPTAFAAVTGAREGRRQVVEVVTDLLDVPWQLMFVAPAALQVDPERPHLATMGTQTQLTMRPRAVVVRPALTLAVSRATVLVPRQGLVSATYGARVIPSPLMTAVPISVEVATTPEWLAAAEASQIIHVTSGPSESVDDQAHLPMGDGESLAISDLRFSASQPPLVFLDVNGGGRLAPALLAAGAGAVIAPAWPVDNEITTQVSEVFYRELLAGRASADALAEAQTQAAGAGPEGALAQLAFQHFGTNLTVRVDEHAQPAVPLTAPVDELAAEYERIRREMRSGPTRTAVMSQLVEDLKTALGPLSDYPWQPGLLTGSLGQRLASFVWLGLRPQPSTIGALVHAIVDLEPKPFGQLTGLNSLVAVLGAAPEERLAPEDLRGLVEFREREGWATDRGRVISQILSLQGPTPTAAGSSPETDQRLRAARAAVEALTADRTAAELGEALTSLAMAYLELGRTEDGLATLRKIDLLGVAESRDWNPDLVHRLRDLSDTHIEEGQHDLAAAQLDRAIFVCEGGLNSDPAATPMLADLLLRRSRVRLDHESADSSLEMARRAVAVLDDSGDVEETLRLEALTEVAQLLSELGRYEEALSMAEATVTGWEEAARRDSRHEGTLYRALRLLARINLHIGRSEVAVELLDDLIMRNLIEGRGMPDADAVKELIGAESDRAEVLRAQGGPAVAEEARLRILREFVGHLPESPDTEALRVDLTSLALPAEPGRGWTDADDDLFDAILRGDQSVTALAPYLDSRPADVAALLSILGGKQQVADALVHVVQSFYPPDPEDEAKVLAFVDRAARDEVNEVAVAMVVEYALYRLHSGEPVSNGRLELGLRLLADGSESSVRPISYGLGQIPGPPAFEDYRRRAIDVLKGSPVRVRGLELIMLASLREQDPSWPTDAAVANLLSGLTPGDVSAVILKVLAIAPNAEDIERLVRAADSDEIVADKSWSMFLRVYDATGDLSEALDAATGTSPS